MSAQLDRNSLLSCLRTNHVSDKTLLCIDNLYFKHEQLILHVELIECILIYCDNRYI